MSGKTILYVEDNELNRRLVRDLLKRTTYKLIEAHDGEAGIAAALTERPDLILMDIQLPKNIGTGCNTPPPRRSLYPGNTYRCTHLICVERRRPESEGCWRHRLPRKTL